jgi:hypothetical protein
MDREQVRKVVAATLDQTYQFWDCYYVPSADDEEEYVDQVTDDVMKELAK